MFIEQGSFVDIVGGSCAGRFGIVRKIRICDQTQNLLIGVDVLNPAIADFELMLFEPMSLKGRAKMTAADRERFEMLYAACTLQRESREAAAGVRS